ncbi:uncharacterized protein LOC142340814 [Convolutriloba macropyga]|uniref:uncharacterized protein LOC142340814 n=1 Tax=Convolutriloba macropyga TaxID=536237 RepID=UPI003F5200EE
MTSDKQKGKSEPVHACICCKLGEKLSCLTLSDCVEGIFYLLLLACLLLSIATTIRSFIVSGEKVTSFQLKSVNEHVHPCFLFYGVDFELDVCSNVKLVAGASDFAGMLADSQSCISKSFNIEFDESMIQNWDELHEQFDAESSFTSSIKRLMEKKGAENNMSMSIIIVRGPSIWIEQDAIYMRVLAPKYNTLHPYYILSRFDMVVETLDQAANISARGQTLQALMTLQNLLEQDKAVFRYLPTESMTLASMFKEEFKEEGTLYHTRITLESTVSTTMYSTDDWDCSFGDYPGSGNNSGPPPGGGSGGGGGGSGSGGSGSVPAETTTNNPNPTGSGGDDPFEYSGKGSGGEWGYDDWSHHDKSYDDILSSLCGGTADGFSYSESTFRWFDGLVRETNTYDPFNPWSVFSTLTSIVLAIDRIYTTLKRYKTAYNQHHHSKTAVESCERTHEVQFHPADKGPGALAFVVHDSNPKAIN